MICQNCQANVDNDLIFCTNCGERLLAAKNAAQTVLMKDSGVTGTSIPNAPKTSSSLKWIALIIGLIAIPASLFGIYLLTNLNNQQVSQNINKPGTPVSTLTPKTNTNRNSNANISNTNANTTNANVNTNTNSVTKNDKTVIMDERIEVAAKSNYAVPFKVTDETVKIVGKVKILEGEKIKGFVYLQKMFDEHFPDEIYKVFSFDGAKEIDVNQTLVKENYVLVFINDGEKSVVIQGNFSVE